MMRTEVLHKQKAVSLQIPHISPQKLSDFISLIAEGHGDLRNDRAGLNFARRLGVVAGRGSEVALTTFGHRLYQLLTAAPSMIPEAIHLHLYSAYMHPASWAYAYLVNRLWDCGSVVLDTVSICILVCDLIEDASRELGIPTEKIAFGAGSVRGMLAWLRALDPRVFHRSSFARRHFCRPLVFLWAVSLLYERAGRPVGVRLSLSSERVDWLCRACLLAPAAFDDMLMWARRQSDYARGGLFDYGTEGGWGRWIYLKENLFLGDIPSI